MAGNRAHAPSPRDRRAHPVAKGFAAAALEGKGVHVRFAKAALYAALPLSLAALAAISIAYSADREDRFEVAVISITWLLMLPASAALTFEFRAKAMISGTTGDRG